MPSVNPNQYTGLTHYPFFNFAGKGAPGVGYVVPTMRAYATAAIGINLYVEMGFFDCPGAKAFFFSIPALYSPEAAESGCPTTDLMIDFSQVTFKSGEYGSAGFDTVTITVESGAVEMTAEYQIEIHGPNLPITILSMTVPPPFLYAVNSGRSILFKTDNISNNWKLGPTSEAKLPVAFDSVQSFTENYFDAWVTLCAVNPPEPPAPPEIKRLPKFANFALPVNPFGIPRK